MDHCKIRKLEMPSFDDENPNSWLYRAELCFEINLLTDTEKMIVPLITFSSSVVDGYCWTDNHKKVESWEDLKTRMFEFYRHTQEVSLCVKFLSIKQDGTMTDYIKKFMTYPAPLLELAEDVLENTFLLGLQLEVRDEVVSRRPIGLEDIMVQAQIVEDRNLALKLYIKILAFGQR